MPLPKGGSQNLPVNILKILYPIINIVILVNGIKDGLCFYNLKKILITITPSNGIKINLYDDEAEFKTLLSQQDILKPGTIKSRSSIFIDHYILPKYQSVCTHAKRSLQISNAGGQSEISEMYSIDYFYQLYNGKNVILETEVDYWIDSKMIDFIVYMGGKRVGISVARAMGFPTADNFTYESAVKLLNKKILGLLVARNSVSKKHIFNKSILHIWCQNYTIASLIYQAFLQINPDDYILDVKGKILIQLTISNDEQIYKNNVTL